MPDKKWVSLFSRCLTRNGCPCLVGLRLKWRELIKQTIRNIVLNPEIDPLTRIQDEIVQQVPSSEQSALQALIVDELRRLHEGVLARYGLRPSEYVNWRERREE